MKKLHKSHNDTKELEPKEGQQGLLCNNKVSSSCPSLGFEKLEITPERIRTFCDLGITLKKIHTRLLMEGFKFEDGKIIEPNERKQNRIE